MTTPGFFFEYSISSLRLLTGTAGFTEMMLGTLASSATALKSLVKLKAMSLYSAGRMAMDEVGT